MIMKVDRHRSQVTIDCFGCLTIELQAEIFVSSLILRDSGFCRLLRLRRTVLANPFRSKTLLFAFCTM